MLNWKSCPNVFKNCQCPDMNHRLLGSESKGRPIVPQELLKIVVFLFLCANYFLFFVIGNALWNRRFAISSERGLTRTGAKSFQNSETPFRWIVAVQQKWIQMREKNKSICHCVVFYLQHKIFHFIEIYCFAQILIDKHYVHETRMPLHPDWPEFRLTVK